MKTMERPTRASPVGLILLCFTGLSLAQTTARVQYPNYCSSTTDPVFTLALIGGVRASEGRLEVYQNGQWGTVCRENFTEREAQAVCRSLGFSGGYEMTCFEEGKLLLDDKDPKPIWLSNVNCAYRWWFQDCSFAQQHDCDHSQDVFIRCMPNYFCQERPDTSSCEAMYKPRTLKTSKIRKLADLSDRTSFKKDLLNPLLRVRDVGSAGHTQARQHIVNQMRSVGWNIEEDRFDDSTPLGRKTFTNVIATQNVNAPRRLTIACHYDSKYFTQFQFIAMSDSAVPCAMMLDLARTLNESLWKNRDSKGAQISLQFLFFDGEEAFISWTKTDSIYGSRHLAAKWENEKVQIYREMPPMSQNARMDALILLDLIGYKNPTFKNWFTETSHLFERLKKIELRLVREKSLEFEYESKSSQYFTGSVMAGLGVEDDHIPFLQRGVPIMHLIAYPFPQVWHNEQDNASNYDPVSTDNLLKIMRVFIAEYLHLDP